jgi:hypothetical protein
MVFCAFASHRQPSRAAHLNGTPISQARPRINDLETATERWHRNGIDVHGVNVSVYLLRHCQHAGEVGSFTIEGEASRWSSMRRRLQLPASEQATREGATWRFRFALR